MKQLLLRNSKVGISLIIVCTVLIGSFIDQVERNNRQFDYELIPGSAEIFPSFGSAPEAYVIDVPNETSLAMQLTLTSLQGLVNRNGARIWFNMESDNLSFLLPFIEERNGVNFTRISILEFLQNFSSFATGLIVYDPDNINTINIATVMAGINDYVIVSPSSINQVSNFTGLSVAIDLCKRPWSDLNPLQLYRKSFRDHYPLTDRNLLAILPPEKIGSRDYIIAASIWTFYANQGPFSSQEDIDLTEDILSSTPHNIPVIGWFETPTLVEENYFVQVASRYGKFILGGHNFPNLSFLTSLNVSQPLQQKRTIPITPELQDDGIYLSFAVPDGDNLDFIADMMLRMWRDDARGTIPVTWSLNPILTKLAPSLIDYFYFEASNLDSFVASPSGAGYLYPDFMIKRDLDQYLLRTKSAMMNADMDIVWLLNSFKAYEIPYTRETLQGYIKTLTPRGLILDYADQASSHDVWIDGSQSFAAPVIRSTHLWSSLENLLGKIMMDVDASPSRPHFFVVTVYPWTLNLNESLKALESLQRRYGSRVNAVSIENLFSLVTEFFIHESEITIEDVERNFLATLDFWDIDAARNYLGKAKEYQMSGKDQLAGLYGYLALERANRALASGAIILLALIVVFFLILVYLLRFSKEKKSKRSSRNNWRWLYPGIATTFLFYLFFSGLQKALEYNFWTYLSVFLAGIAIILATRLQLQMKKILGQNAQFVEIGIITISGLFLLLESWAFVPFSAATTMLIHRFLNTQKMRKEKVAIYFGFGLSCSIFFTFNSISLAISIIVLTILVSLSNPSLPKTSKAIKKIKTPGVTFAATTFALPVIWIALFQNRYFVEKFRGGIDLLIGLSTICLIIAPIIALIVWRSVPVRYRLDAVIVLGLSSIFWIALWFIQSLTFSTILIFIIAIFVSWSYLSASFRVDWTGTALSKFVSNLLILSTIVIVIVQMPAIVYSLYIIKLPLAAEYVLYTPPLLMIFVTLDIVQTEALFKSAKKGKEKAAHQAENETQIGK